MINVPEDLRGMHVVVIDDEPANRLLLQRFLEDAGFTDLTLIGDANSVIPTLQERAPDLLVLDLHMPGRDGFSLLEEIRTKFPEWRQVPILVFTADVTREARQRALELGANDFLTKPGEAIEIVLRVRNFLRTRKLYRELESYSLDLENKVRQRTEELAKATEDCLWRLARASEYRDDDTGEHTLRVGVLSSYIADKLGLDCETAEMIRRAAPLHDIGKIGIPDTILLKPGKLTDEEFEVMRSHVKIGSSLLAGSASKLMIMAEEIALSHHERWDGTGYSQGLKGEDIPITGRIVSVADVFDALTHDRPYKQAWPKEKAIEEIQSLAGSHFDPQVVDAFMAVVETYDAGKLV